MTKRTGPQFYTVDELAELMNTTPNNIYSAHHRKRTWLPRGVKLGPRLMFKCHEVHEFLDNL